MARLSLLSLPKRFSVHLVFIVYVMLICPVQSTGNDVLILDRPPGADLKEAQPLIYWSESWWTPRPVRFYFLRIDLRNPEYEVFTILADDPDGDGPAEAQLESPIRLAEHYRAVAAINANAFRVLSDTHQEKRNKRWFHSKAVDIAGLAVSDGSVRSQPERGLSAFWIDLAGKPHIGNPTSTNEVLQGVADWIDRLLVNGKVVAKKRYQLHPRTLVGIDRGGRYLLFVVADGRQVEYSEGISLYEAAMLMKEHGCHNAANLDGGGSSIILVLKENQLRVMNHPSDGRPRPIPVMLGLRQREQPKKNKERPIKR